MADYSDAVPAILDRFRALWTATPVKYPDEDLELPRDDAGNALPFMAIEIIWTGGANIAIGAPGSTLKRYGGHVWLSAFVRRGSGIAAAHANAAAAALLFENQDFGEVSCQAAEPGGGGSAEEHGLYWRESVSVPFTIDAT
jgi:hypothetical protein